jgi:hypothetical protein
MLWLAINVALLFAITVSSRLVLLFAINALQLQQS